MPSELVAFAALVFVFAGLGMFVMIPILGQQWMHRDRMLIGASILVSLTVLCWMLALIYAAMAVG